MGATKSHSIVKSSRIDVGYPEDFNVYAINPNHANGTRPMRFHVDVIQNQRLFWFYNNDISDDFNFEWIICLEIRRDIRVTTCWTSPVCQTCSQKITKCPQRCTSQVKYAKVRKLTKRVNYLVEMCGICSQYINPADTEKHNLKCFDQRIKYSINEDSFNPSKYEKFEMSRVKKRVNMFMSIKRLRKSLKLKIQKRKEFYLSNNNVYPLTSIRGRRQEDSTHRTNAEQVQPTLIIRKNKLRPIIPLNKSGHSSMKISQLMSKYRSLSHQKRILFPSHCLTT